MFRPYQNGAAPPTPQTKNTKGQRDAANAALKANGYKALSTVQKSEVQQQWIAKHIKGEITRADFVEQWKKAGFGSNPFGGISRAIKGKILKKVSPGVYRPA